MPTLGSPARGFGQRKMTIELESTVDREIEESVREALARCGAAGSVRVSGEEVVAEGYGPTVRLPISDLLRAWPGLAPDVKRRRCTELARLLIQSRNAAAGGPRSSASHGLGGQKTVSWLKIAGGVAVATLAIWGARAWVASRSSLPWARGTEERPTTSASSGADQIERQRRLRAQRVCQNTQTRVERGASVGPTDVEGWVVEILMLRQGNAEMISDPSIDPLIALEPDRRSGRIVWAGAPVLSGLGGPQTRVHLEQASLGGSPEVSALTLTFSGRYVSPYFTKEQRPEMVAFASELSSRLGVDFAGLYGRCASATTHHLGSWFRGADLAKATAALLYVIGSYARTPQLGALAGDSGDRSRLLGTLAEAAARLPRAEVSMLVGRHGGMIAGRPGQSAMLLFPFDDGNRAARASREIVGALSSVPSTHSMQPGH